MHLMAPSMGAGGGALNTTNSTLVFALRTALFLSTLPDRSPNNSLQDYAHLPSGASLDPNQPKCYGVYGCFPIEFPWTTDKRLVSLYPQSPETIRPKFPVFNRHRRVIPLMLDLNDPLKTHQAHIDPLGRLFVLAHGYIDSGDRPWIQDLVVALIEAEPSASVLIVDWGGGSNPPYSQAVANTRLVGAIAAHVLEMVHSIARVPMERMHMIGHSLGAHLAGYTGLTLQRDFNLKLARITGLDPAEPLFTDTETEVRLDPSDAQFVDVVHTDTLQLTMGGLGMQAPIGHVDFYPNGGNNNPGCDISLSTTMRGSMLFGGIQQFLSCNHLRSIRFLTESIRSASQPYESRCPFLGITCSSFDDFKHGHCFRCNEDGNQCVRFGLDSIESYQGLKSVSRLGPDGRLPRVYMMTGDGNGQPYCRVHYKLTVVMANGEDSRLHGSEIGVLKVEVRSQSWALEEEKRQRLEKLRGIRMERTEEEWQRLRLGVGHRGDENVTEAMRFSEYEMLLEPGQTYTAVMAGSDVGVPTHATLRWEYSPNPLNPMTWRLLSTPRIYIDYVVLESLEHGSEIRLCSMLGKAVTTTENNLFLAEYCEYPDSR